MYKQQQQQQRQLQQQVQCNLTCRHSRALPRTAPPSDPSWHSHTIITERSSVRTRDRERERGKEEKRAHVSRGGEAAQQRDVGIDAARTPQIATWKLVYVSFAAAKWATTTSKVGHKGLPPLLSLCLPLSRHVSHST